MKQNPAYIEKQVQEKKNEIERAHSFIETLNKKRALKMTKENASVARARRIEDIDREIEDCRRILKNLPHEITALEEQLEQAKKDEDYNREILKTSPPLGENQRLSKVLLKQLEQAKLTSDRLIEMRQARNLIRRQTGRSLGAPCTCSGFYSLKLLVEICQRECDGGGGRVSHRYKNLPEQLI